MVMNIEELTIREMTAGDGELFVAFYAALSEETLKFFTPHDPRPEKLRALIAAIPTEPNVRRFAATRVGENGEEMAGYVFLWDLDTAVPWLGICVNDRYKGQGVGTRLMRYVENYCQDRHKGGILLTTHVENIIAQGLYRKVGYEVIGTDHRGELLMILRIKDERWRDESCA